MTSTYTWKITNLDREVNDGFVYQAHYAVIATSDQVDADGNAYVPVKSYGCVSLDRPDVLVPFDDLTEDQVIAWVQTKLGGPDKVQEIQSALEARIQERINPTKLNGVPWGN